MPPVAADRVSQLVPEGSACYPVHLRPGTCFGDIDGLSAAGERGSTLLPRHADGIGRGDQGRQRDRGRNDRGDDGGEVENPDCCQSLLM